MEIISNQQKGIDSSTINATSLIELKGVTESLDAFSKIFKESLDAQSSKIDDIQKIVNESADTVNELKQDQAQLKLEFKSIMSTN